jgi:hypothetical protein
LATAHWLPAHASELLLLSARETYSPSDDQAVFVHVVADQKAKTVFDLVPQHKPLEAAFFDGEVRDLAASISGMRPLIVMRGGVLPFQSMFFFISLLLFFFFFILDIIIIIIINIIIIIILISSFDRH